MDTTTITVIAIVVALLIVAAIVYLIRAGSDPAPGATIDAPAPGHAPGTPAIPPAPAVTHPGAASAVEDVVGEFLGVDAHADIVFPPATGPADPLTLIKGLGPKASGLMAQAGITRFDQLAALSDAQQAVLDEKMGTFRGRMARDRWVEQAGHLASGDNAGFEAKFGKLGG